VSLDDNSSVATLEHRVRILTQQLSRADRELATSAAVFGRGLFSKLSRVCEQYLDVVLEFAGARLYDERLRKAVQMQRAVVDAFPAAPAAQGFEKLAQAADNWPVVGHASGRIEFFVEQLIQAGRVVEESQA
jgi:flagellar biosynthesis protein FlhG